MSEQALSLMQKVIATASDPSLLYYFSSQLTHHIHKVGEAIGYDFCPLNHRLTLGDQSRNDQGHCQAMVTATMNLGTAQVGWTIYDEAILSFLNGRTHRPQLGYNRGNTIGFLYSQLTGIAYHRLALGLSGCNGEDRELIDHTHYRLPAHLSSPQPAAQFRFVSATSRAFPQILRPPW
jgi:hypothetical protein